MKKKFIVPYMLAGAATFVGGLHFTESIASPINSEGQRYTIKSYEKLDNSSDSVLNVEEWAYTEPYAIKTIERKSDVLYIMSTGDTICRTGGTRAWRNNNPGNIRPGRFTDSAGSIGRAGGFAAFPDEQTGMDAIILLLKTPRYQAKTLAQAISAWAPPSDGNNTSSYQQQVSNETGVALSTPLHSLNDSQLWQVARIIRRIEGWTTGRETQE